MFKRRSRLVLPMALISLVAGSSLVLAACSSDDEQPDRQASGGKNRAWEGSTGNSFGSYRGVEVEFINSFRIKDRPIIVGVAAKGWFCPESPDSENPCRTKRGGSPPREIPPNEFGKWSAYNGEILFNVDANRLGKFESTLEWPRDGGKANGVGFSVTNPAIGRPRFTIRSDSSCPKIGSQELQLAEGKSSTVTDETSRCQVKLKVTRLGDSKQFKRFTIEAL
jgi:hypothetical protein